jgi:epoxyqueuosine reductase QueG
MTSLTKQIKELAHAQGFELVGIAAAQAAPGWERFSQWLSNGYAGEMRYLETGAMARQSPDSIVPACQVDSYVGHVLPSAQAT